MGSFRVGAGIAVLGCVVGCGGQSGSTPSGDGGSGPATTGAAGSGTTRGGQASAGTMTSGGTSSGGTSPGGTSSGGAAPLGCDGAWPAATSAMPPVSGVLLFSPALSPDALELIYARQLDVTGNVGFYRSTRATTSEGFAMGSPLPELDSACAATTDWRSVDLSADGLRAYVVCYSSLGDTLGAGQLHVAARASRGASFVYQVGESTVGPGAAISSAELTLYTSNDVQAGQYPPLQFTRTDTGSLFGPGMPIPGLEAVNVSAPDISPDDLVIYGGLNSNLVLVARDSSSAAFGAPQDLFLAANSTEQLGAPELSRDCRSLLYLRQTYEAGVVTSELMLSRR